jgi:uncharacterized protein (TIGR03437 family)
MRPVIVTAILMVGGSLLRPQDDAGVRPLSWAVAGARAVELNLAGPAGDAVAEVFFSADGRRLYARTGRGATWASDDLGDTWNRVDARVEDPRRPEPAEALGLPPGDRGAAVYRHSYDSRHIFALGEHLHRSSDQGRTWVNLTADPLGPIIGPGQRAIAFSAASPDLLIVANSRGLWRSADGGLSWISLNTNLPNLPPARLRRPGEGPVRVFLRGVGPAEWNAAGLWQPVRDAAAEDWLRLASALPEGDRRRIAPWPLEMPEGWLASFRIWRQGEPVSPDLTFCATGACAEPERHYISSFAVAGDRQPRYYAGTSDGHLWVSTDGGRTWQPPRQGFAANENPVTALWADRRNAFAAIAVLGSGQVFRTTNGGLFWDELTANLPRAAAHAVAANSETGSIYVATDAGLFHTRGDLRNPAPATPWTRLGGNLPEGPIEDVRVDTATGTLYAAAAGHGLYRATVPDIADSLRILNAADLSARAAAPGGLLTVIGAAVSAARAERWNVPVLAAGPTESQIQVPFEARGPTLSLALETQRGLRRASVPLEAVSPAIFVDADGSPLVLDAGAGVLLDASRPARAGSQILILATGLGEVRPEWPTGLPAPLEDPPTTVAPVAAYLNGAPLRVVSSTLAGGYIGVYMVRVQLPAVINSGTGELVISAGDKTSNRVRIYLEPG